MDYRPILGTGIVVGILSGSAIATHATPLQLSPTPPLLSAADVASALDELPHWITDGQQLSCTFEFANFVESVGFVNSLVEPAEALGHHPDLKISYNQVTVTLTTHDAGGLTPLDIALARAIAQPCPPPAP